MKKDDSGKKATVYMCLPQNLVDWLKEESKRQNRSVSGLATHVLLAGKGLIEANAALPALLNATSLGVPASGGAAIGIVTEGRDSPRLGEHRD